MKIEYILAGIVGIALGAGGVAYLAQGEAAAPETGMADVRMLTAAEKEVRYKRAPEITTPAGYINTNDMPITIGEFKGNKVVLIDFWTYSCINCQRTLPYLRAWYDKYHDMGLEIIAIHTPEFAFEKVKSNVQKAVDGFGLEYPSVLDNDYATWNAFGNQYWPRKYLIDIDGFIVYDHIGEGSYEETERAIQRALAEREERLGMEGSIGTDVVAPAGVVSVDSEGLGSPETYFGAGRNEYLGNGKKFAAGVQSLSVPEKTYPNTLYLGGTWNISEEYSLSQSAGSIVYTYKARDVYFVASATSMVKVELLLDGKPIGSAGGADVASDGTVTINENRLYHLVHTPEYGQHTLEIKIDTAGLDAYTFTFG
jgi:thiol-disulfide isomerase/thioredoxin